MHGRDRYPNWPDNLHHAYACRAILREYPKRWLPSAPKWTPVPFRGPRCTLRPGVRTVVLHWRVSPTFFFVVGVGILFPHTWA